MKLEKFDYQIDNKKTKRKFVALGGLCIALIVTVVLYKTFASFSSSASFTIIESRVGTIGEARTAVVTIPIGKTEEDHVNAILYDDNTLSIEGSGYMQDFSGVDLIGNVLESYIAESDNIFSADDLYIINTYPKAAKSILEIAGRSSFMVKDDTNFEDKIAALFVDDNNEPITADIEKAIAMARNFAANSGFAINSIEINGDVKNIGVNAFNLKAAIAAGDTRYDLYKYDTLDYNDENNVWETFDTVTLNANLESVGDPSVHASAVSDLYATSIVINDGVTTIPNDLFAWYGDKLRESSSVVKDNQVVSLPDSVTSIGNNAFYLYKGASLTIPANIAEIDQYAFASYDGADITIPATSPLLKANAFAGFTHNINMSSCPVDKTFAPNASIVSNNTVCAFE